MRTGNLRVDLTHYDAADPSSVRLAIDTIKAEHGVSETVAYAALIRAVAGVWNPARHPVEPSDRDGHPLSTLHVPTQRNRLAG